MDINHKYDRKILSQNEELAKIRKEKRLDKRLEARVSKIEDTEMKMDIKVTSVSTHFRFPSVLHCLTQFLKKNRKHNRYNNKSFSYCKVLLTHLRLHLHKVSRLWLHLRKFGYLCLHLHKFRYANVFQFLYLMLDLIF